MAVGAATHMRSMQAGFLGPGRGAGGGARAARHHRLEGRRRGPLRHLQDLYPRQRAGLERDRRTGSASAFRSLEKHGFKVWPACAYTRPTNAATLYLREKHGLRPEDIESITIVGGTGGTQQLCEPLEMKRRPQDQHRRQVQHSVHYRGHDGERQRHAARLHGGGPARSGGARDGGPHELPRRHAKPITGKGGSSDVSRDLRRDRDEGRQALRAPVDGRAGRPEEPGELGSAGSEVPGLRFVLGAAGFRGERRSRDRVDQESRERRGRDRDRPGCCRNRDRRATTCPRKLPSSAPATAARCTAPRTAFPSSATRSSCGPTLAGVDLRFANCERQYSSRGTRSERRPARPPAARDGEDLHRLRLRRGDDRQQPHVRLRSGGAARYPCAAARERHRGDRRRQRTSPKRASPRSSRRTASRSASSATAR